MILKAYLDTNVVSAIARDHIPQESAAVENLLRASEQGRVELLTSRVTEEEIARYSGAGQRVLDRVYRLIRKVAYVETSTLLGFNSYGDRYTWISSPLMEDDPTWARLKAIGLDHKDAHHVMVAIKSSCDLFLTCDGGILHHHSQIEKEFGIRLLRPSDSFSTPGWTELNDSEWLGCALRL